MYLKIKQRKFDEIDSKTGLDKARKAMMKMVYEEESDRQHKAQNLEELLVKLKAKPVKKPYANYKTFKENNKKLASSTKCKSLGSKDV